MLYQYVRNIKHIMAVKGNMKIYSFHVPCEIIRFRTGGWSQSRDVKYLPNEQRALKRKYIVQH